MAERFTWPDGIGPERDDSPDLDALAAAAEEGGKPAGTTGEPDVMLQFGGMTVDPADVTGVLLGEWVTLRPGSLTIDAGRQAGCTFTDGSNRTVVTTVGEITAVRIKPGWSA